jgi:hypothetical protein
MERIQMRHSGRVAHLLALGDHDSSSRHSGAELAAFGYSAWRQASKILARADSEPVETTSTDDVKKGTTLHVI